MSAEPTPPPAWALAAGAELLGLAVAIIALGFLMVWGLIAISKQSPSVMVVATVGLLTLAAIGAFVMTESDILGTIAATGVGALAGAVTSLFDRRRPPPSDPD